MKNRSLLSLTLICSYYVLIAVAGNLFSNSISLDSTSIMDNSSNNVVVSCNFSNFVLGVVYFILL